MSDKLTCVGCNACTSSVLQAVRRDDPCPHCGLSAEAIVEVLMVRERGANAEVTAQYEAARIRADRAEERARRLGAQLDQIRAVVTAETEG